MADIFISHSWEDKAVASNVARDLRSEGHTVWFDEWAIKVGGCIASKIEEGIGKADFLLLLLSNHAVRSHWVEREWKAAYWEEVKSNRIIVLPVCIEPCAIPKLLTTKRYAVLHDSYETGIRDVIQAIRHYLRTQAREEFFHLADVVRNRIERQEEHWTLFRNEHWDSFAENVGILRSEDRLAVQKTNT